MSCTRLSVRIGAIATVITLAACGSSGGSGSSVSQSKLEAKLRSEPQIQSLLQQGGTKAKVTSQLVDCVAQALEKDANQSDLKKYVDGKMNLNDIGGKTKGSGNNAKVTVQNCARTAINHDKSSTAA